MSQDSIFEVEQAPQAHTVHRKAFPLTSCITACHTEWFQTFR